MLLLAFQMLALLETGCVPHLLSEKFPPALIFCFTSFFFKFQSVLVTGFAIMCPCANYKGGLEREYLGF